MSTEYWSNGKKLAYIMSATLIGMTMMAFYWEWEALPTRAVVPGARQSLTKSFDVILRSPAKRYLIFTSSLIDSALAGAQLRTTPGIDARIVQISADSGRIHEYHGRYDSFDYPGLHLHVSGEVVGTGNRSVGNDSLWLQLPGLARLGLRLGDIPMIVRNEPRALDSSIVEIYTHFPSLAAAQRARLPWLMAWVIAALLLVALALHAILRTVLDEGTSVQKAMRDAFGSTAVANATPHHSSRRRRR